MLSSMKELKNSVRWALLLRAEFGVLSSEMN
jgi:hypothetical protein